MNKKFLVVALVLVALCAVFGVEALFMPPTTCENGCPTHPATCSGIHVYNPPISEYCDRGECSMPMQVMGWTELPSGQVCLEGEVRETNLQTVVDAIHLWVQKKLSLSEVVEIIKMWRTAE